VLGAEEDADYFAFEYKVEPKIVLLDEYKDCFYRYVMK